MIWLFHRHGEYLSCEVRTCIENDGFELVIARSSDRKLEWYPDADQVTRRWERLQYDLQRQGWLELYEADSCQLSAPSSRGCRQ
jgi:hypothetical protein